MNLRLAEISAIHVLVPSCPKSDPFPTNTWWESVRACCAGAATCGSRMLTDPLPYSAGSVAMSRVPVDLLDRGSIRF